MENTGDGAFVLSADIGGSHITAAVVDMTARQVVRSTWARRKTDPCCPEAAELIGAWSETLAEARGEMNISKVSLSMPGPLDYENGISYIKDQGKFESLYKLNIRELLAKELGLEGPCIKFTNDAACFLQGEVFGGTVSENITSIGVTLGTGLGSAVCVNGKAENADMWKIPFDGSIAEDFISTRWFKKRYEELTGRSVSGVSELSGKAEAEPVIKEIFETFGNSLGRFIVMFLQHHPAEAVVVGGNIAHAWPRFSGAMMLELNKHFPDIHIQKALLGEEAPLLGAASAWDGQPFTLNPTQ
ncbi:ROK family protein [Chitinophaga sp. GCM10012297]|uniref:ROK family protein n=1 Tax=Chitinophaga chungangae TaxID=2821488 RepID=A0ABS3YFK1_9BACT|nr:ROK family protein [Chitinophaga chungangae]MBO9153457.1 ROK family protein [Chitinophaga chungangae]